MSMNDLVDDLERRARVAVVEAGAVKGCSFHSDVLIRLGDVEAERRAYAFATAQLKRDDAMYLREELMSAVEHELGMAADGECPQCARHRDD